MAAEGYGAAHGRFIIMSDADDSYEFLLLPGFIEKLHDRFIPGLAVSPAAAEVRCGSARYRGSTSPKQSDTPVHEAVDVPYASSMRLLSMATKWYGCAQ
jgi:hypothetical protein